jgi:TolB-like protein
MAPEQLFEGRVDERADIFSAAAIVYEMLAGQAAFNGKTLTAILHAVGYDEPVEIDRSPEHRRVDLVLRQALVKDPTQRIGRAEQFAALLREARDGSQPVPAPQARAKRTRFVALPLRVLKADPETDFLAFSIPDAVSVALATLESVAVRSPQAGMPADADIRAVGRDLSVDVILTGTLLRAGRNVRVSAQLADAAGGTLIWADVAQAPLEDLFQLQDVLTEKIVGSLKLPLTAQDRRSLDRQAPASAEAYEMYLRANELARDPAGWRSASDVYRRSVEIDPAYAPAWARLGRTERVIAKWAAAPSDTKLLASAEAAFRRAFEIDPDLSIAHDLAAYVDAELGRAPHAMERLLARAAKRPSDTGVLAGLVTTCRYAGLLDVSRAAHQRAITIDQSQVTSVSWSHMMVGDYEAAIRLDRGFPPYCAMLSQLVIGQITIERMRHEENSAPSAGTRLAIGAYRSTFEGDIEGALRILDELAALGFDDPEGWYLYAFCLMRNGAGGPALDYATRAVDGGYICHEALQRPEWAVMSGTPAYQALLARTAAAAARNRERYLAADGPAILAAPIASTGVSR